MQKISSPTLQIYFIHTHTVSSHISIIYRDIVNMCIINKYKGHPPTSSLTESKCLASHHTHTRKNRHKETLRACADDVCPAVTFPLVRSQGNVMTTSCFSLFHFSLFCWKWVYVNLGWFKFYKKDQYVKCGSTKLRKQLCINCATVWKVCLCSPVGI